MLYKDYTGACDGLIKTGYHFCKSMTEDEKYKLRMTEKQKTILLGLAERLVRTVLNECEIIEENPPIKVKVRIKRKKP